jgi:hypothetical protein
MNSKLRWEYEAVRKCSRDEDCNYVDGFYDMIERDRLDLPVTTVACGVRVPYLIVANGRALQAQLAALKADLDRMAMACADPEEPPPAAEGECQVRGGFLPKASPVCQQGSCQPVRGDGYYGLPIG